MFDIRRIVETANKNGFINVIKEPVSVIHGISYNLRLLDGRGPVLFEKPIMPDGKGSKFRVLGGIANNRTFVKLLLGLNTEREISKRILTAIGSGIKPVEVEKTEAPVMRNSVEGDKVDIGSLLPILKHYDGEPSRYITAGIVIAYDDENKIFSASYHRMMLISKNTFTLRIVEGRKLYKLVKRAEKNGKDLKVVVSIGSELGLIIAAATPAEDRDRVEIAGSIQGDPISIVREEDLVIPAFSEIVLVGRIIPWDLKEEGPFYEIIGKDIVRKQPILVVDKILYRDEAIYQAILPASKEHEMLMGLPVEAVIFDSVSKYCDVLGVYITPGGFGWLEAAISIRKNFEGQPVMAAIAAINAHRSLKRIIVVDDDIDVYNYEEVMRAVNQRAHVPDDYIFIKSARGSTLDHSNIRYMEIDGMQVAVVLPQSKLIIDATIKGPKELYERPIIPK
jgi:UbiD family decarboxylase